MSGRLMIEEREPDRNKRINVVAKFLVSKRYSRKLKGKYKTFQMMIENENFIHKKVASLEVLLRREVSIYDHLRNKKSRICLLRRQAMYYRLFCSLGLTIPAISWLLDAKPSTIKSNIAVAYREYSRWRMIWNIDRSYQNP